MNPTILIRSVAATLAASTLLLAQSAPVPDAQPRAQTKTVNKANERLQVRLAEVIAMLEEDDLSAEQRAEAKKKLEEIRARLRDAATAPVPPTPAAPPVVGTRAVQSRAGSAARTDTVETKAVDVVPRERAVVIQGEPGTFDLKLAPHAVGHEHVPSAPQEPAPPAPAKAPKAPKAPKPPKALKPATVEGFDVVELQPGQHPLVVQGEGGEVYTLGVGSAEGGAPVRVYVQGEQGLQELKRKQEAEVQELQAKSKALQAEAGKLQEKAAEMRPKVLRYMQQADEAKAKAKSDEARERTTYTLHLAEHEAAREQAREAAQQARAQAELYRKAAEDFRATARAKAEAENDARTEVTRKSTREAVERAMQRKASVDRAVEGAPVRTRVIRDRAAGGDDAEIRALIDEMRAEMREIRALIEAMRKQTSQASGGGAANPVFGQFRPAARSPFGGTAGSPANQANDEGGTATRARSTWRASSVEGRPASGARAWGQGGGQGGAFGGAAGGQVRSYAPSSSGGGDGASSSSLMR